MIELLALALVLLAFYGLFYGHVVRHWAPAANWLVGLLGQEATRSVRELEAIGKLAAAGVAQAGFAALLLVATGTDPAAVAGADPLLVAAGVALGAGELGVATLLCAAIVQADAARAAAGGRRATWLAEARGGWMGHFSATVAAAPPWFAALSVALYVGGEELVFRAIVVSEARELGAPAAVALSTALFAAVQPFNMPSRRAAVFPLVGALVVGVVHGILFWHVPDVVPLAVAHVTFFAGALTLAGASRATAPAG